MSVITGDQMTHEKDFYIEFEGEITLDLILSGNAEDGHELKPVDIEETVRRYVNLHVTPKFIKQIENQIEVLETDGKTVSKMLAAEKKESAEYKAGVKYDQIKGECKRFVKCAEICLLTASANGIAK
jgi:hypothetical protein